MEQAIYNVNLIERLQGVKRQSQIAGGPTLTTISEMSGVNRATVSGIVNGKAIPTPAQEARLWSALQSLDLADADEGHAEPNVVAPVAVAPTTYKRSLEIYETQQYREAIGWCNYVRERRKMGVMIGHPGSGKTTVLKEFCRLTGAHYIECWPMTKVSDLLLEIAAAMGIALARKGTLQQTIKDLIQQLKTRDDVVLVFDEAEQLTEDKGGVKKIEMLRKIWDNTGTPIIFAGTVLLRNLITRGGGRENLAQLYRRKYEIELKGITEKEVRAILRDYNVAADAALELTKVATDVRHGGMGNFVELLGLCLDAANGDRIDAATLAGAKKYKLMY